MNNQKVTSQTKQVVNYAKVNVAQSKVYEPNKRQIPTPVPYVKPNPPEAKAPTPSLTKFIETRNIEITKFILEMKLIKFEQLVKRFFEPNDDKQLAYAKSAVNNLSELGYLSVKDKTLNSESIMYPTQIGHDYLKSIAKDKVVPLVKRSFTPATNHDLKLVDLRLKIESFKYFSKFYSERMLESINATFAGLSDLPDGLIKKKNERSFFLELEISKKSVPSYERRIEEYKTFLSSTIAEEKQIDGVMFVCTDPEVYKIIKEIAEKQTFPISVKLFDEYINLDYKTEKKDV